MSNVYENLSSGNFNNHIDSDGQNGGSVIENKPNPAKGVKKVLLNVGLTAMTSAALAGVYGCSPTEAVASTPEPAAVTSVVVHTSNETNPEVSQSPSPEEVGEVETDQNIQNFTNKNDKYTDENESNRLMSYNDNEISLGWMGEGGTTIDFQGEFLGYIRNGDYLIMAVGFNGVDGKNHVKPVAIPIGFFNYSDGQSDKFPFQFVKLGDWSLLTSHKISYETSLEGVKERLDTIKGNPIILTFSTGLKDEDISNKGVARFGEKSRCYFEELKENGQLSTGLMSEVVVEANEDVVSQKTKYSLSSDIKIPDIGSIDDLKNIDISVVPRIFAISSNLW